MPAFLNTFLAAFQSALAKDLAAGHALGERIDQILLLSRSSQLGARSGRLASACSGVPDPCPPAF